MPAMALAADLLTTAAVLAIRATNTPSPTSSLTSSTSSTTSATSTSSAAPVRPPVYRVVGIVLAISSGFFIGVSFVLKKVGLLKANVKYNEAAGEGYGYLKNAFWWTGMTLMIIGEICNFVAYAFVEAILVTPMGALSVVITAILSAVFLKERLSFVGKIGCFMCIVGSVVIVVNAPTQSTAGTIQEMQHYVISPGFLSYAGVIILACVFVAFWAGPRYGKKSMLVYLTICSLIGGLSVVATQGLGAAVVSQIAGTPQFNQWFLYVLLVFVVATLVTEIIYLNKALNLFNAALVTPTYYVYFTSSTIVASSVLFRGFSGSAISIVTVVMGFLVICSGVVLLQLAKSSKDVPDTAVFKGDLDQVRTVAEQEEPEYEPRADTIRGGATIVRAMSKIRAKRQAEEAHRIHSERMLPVGENEEFEWDGLRRRKTTLSSNGGSLSRRKTVHPPLGMTHFPDDTVSEPDSEVHPGFFGRIGRKAQTTSQRRSARSPVPLSTVSPIKQNSDSVSEIPREHVLGLPSGLQKPPALDELETAYKSSGPSAIHWAGNVEDHERGESRASSHLAPPRPPPHGVGNKRQLSFQSVFHRRKSETASDDGNTRPTTRGTLSFSSHKPSSASHRQPTEEERLGLVTGDSSRSLPQYSELYEKPDEDDGDANWQTPSGSSSSSPETEVGKMSKKGGGRGDSDDDDLYDAPPQIPKRVEEGRGGRGRGAFV